MNPKNDVYKVVAAMFGGILFAGLIIFIIVNPPSISHADKKPPVQIDSAKLLSSVPIKPVKVDSGDTETNFNDDGMPTASLADQLKAQQSRNSPSVHHYDYEGMIGKPWVFYKVEDDRLIEIPATDKRLTTAYINWDKFMKSIRDIDITAYPDSAAINITDSTGIRHYKLTRPEPQKYLFVNGQSKLLLVTRTSLVCELYFIFGDDAASVSNMDWEMENK